MSVVYANDADLGLLQPFDKPVLRCGYHLSRLGSTPGTANPVATRLSRKEPVQDDAGSLRQLLPIGGWVDGEPSNEAFIDRNHCFEQAL